MSSKDSQSAENIKQPLENEESWKNTVTNDQRKTSHAYEQRAGVPNEVPVSDTMGTARLEERKPQLQDELEQFRTKENFSNFMKKYYEKQKEVDSLNTELANVRETLEAKIDELTSDITYAYDEIISLHSQIDKMQHPENSENPNQDIESSTRSRENLLKQRIETLEVANKLQADRIKILTGQLHAYANVSNGVPLDDTIGMGERSPLQLKCKLEQLDIGEDREGPEDNEDGTNRAQDSDNCKQENSSKMPKFRKEYNCPVSCVSRVVSFIFDQMRLPVCNTRLHKKVQNELCSLSMAAEEEFIIGKCSLAFENFHHVRLIEKNPTFLVNIEDANDLGGHLKDAIATMEGESRPALFRMHYKKKLDGTTRAGHCVAIMPGGKFMEVKKEDFWEPEKDPLWKTVNKIGVWKVDEKIAEEWEKECALKICLRECKH